MDERLLKDIRETIATWRKQARVQQAQRTKLGHLIAKTAGRDKGGDPGKFTESSYLCIRSCDADQSFRPIPCGVFWLSPDIMVRALAGLGVTTRELRAGDSYRRSSVIAAI